MFIIVVLSKKYETIDQDTAYKTYLAAAGMPLSSHIREWGGGSFD